MVGDPGVMATDVDEPDWQELFPTKATLRLQRLKLETFEPDGRVMMSAKRLTSKFPELLTKKVLVPFETATLYELAGFTNV